MRLLPLLLLPLALPLAPALAQSPFPAAEDGPCSLAAAQPATITRVDESFELLLDDGRRLALAGLEFPGAEGDAGKLRAAALARLSAWLGGADVFVETFAAAPDRWGRLPAQIVAPAQPSPEAPLLSVGAALIGEGLARFRPDSAAAPCAKTYLAAETLPRERKLGFWALDPEIEASGASPASLEALAHKKGTAIVAGTIHSVGETASAVYLNFGPKHGFDFAVVLFKRNLAIFARNGIVPRALIGRRVRVRGLIETNYGPRMEISTPAEIELFGAAPVR